MPHHVKLNLQLNQPVNDTLETDLHGMIHRQLEQHQHHLPEPERISTQLHNDNQQSLSVRITETTSNTVTCELEVMRDAWARTFEETFRPGTVFGNTNQALHGTITQVQHQTWTLETLRDQTQDLGPFEQLELEFVSPTVFTHKHAHWDSPYPDLLLRSLEARWGHAHGPTLQAVGPLLDGIERVRYNVERGNIPIAGKRASRSHSHLPAFMGSLHLTLTGPDDVRHDLATLTAFAARVNVGKRVAYGCGMVTVTGHSKRVGQVRLGVFEF
jgi:CRISPR/Cas system endoribonuclease Cas6 (RAMP superfamily)